MQVLLLCMSEINDKRGKKNAHNPVWFSILICHFRLELSNNLGSNRMQRRIFAPFSWALLPDSDKMISTWKHKWQVLYHLCVRLVRGTRIRHIHIVAFCYVRDWAFGNLSYQTKLPHAAEKSHLHWNDSGCNALIGDMWRRKQQVWCSLKTDDRI